MRNIKNNMKNFMRSEILYSLFFLSSLFSLNCQRSPVQNIQNRYDFFPFTFPIELGQFEPVALSVFGKSIIIVSNDGKVFEIDTQKGLHENVIKVDGEIKGLIQNYIISQNGETVSLYSTAGKKEYEFILGSKKYSFISPSEVVFWRNGNFFIKTAISEDFLFSEENEPNKIFSFRFGNNIFVIWNSNEQSWWWSNGIKKRVGQYTEKEELHFYLSEGSYVAISTRDVLGLKQNIKLFYGEDQEIKDFSVELTFGYAVIRVSSDNFPVGQKIFALYDVFPGRQSDFVISLNQNDIFFLDIQKTADQIPICNAYIGRYINSEFRREALLPNSSCKGHISSNSLFLSVSLFNESLFQSFLFLLWGMKLLKKDTIYSEVYPVYVSDIPYIYLIIYDRDKKTWFVEPRTISFW